MNLLFAWFQRLIALDENQFCEDVINAIDVRNIKRIVLNHTILKMSFRHKMYYRLLMKEGRDFIVARVQLYLMGYFLERELEFSPTLLQMYYPRGKDLRIYLHEELDKKIDKYVEKLKNYEAEAELNEEEKLALYHLRRD